jgi:hypothetical protein
MASTLRSALLPVVDAARGIPGQLGLRLFTVYVVQRTWAGGRPGVGASSDTTTNVKVDLGDYQTKVRVLTSKEVIASGGLYEMQDVEVGPITPPYTGSVVDNDAISVFDPAPTAGVGFELFFKVIGPGYPATGAWFKKISQRVDLSFRYTFVLRRTGKQP